MKDVDTIIKKLNCSTNNQSLYVLAYIPDNISTEIPTVILSHGLSLNHTFMIPYAEKLESMGIASILFDFRGGGYGCKSDGKISEMSLLTQMDDLNAVIDMVQELEFVDNDQLYLAGHSQGGLISSLVAPSRSNEIKSLFLFAPAYVIVDDVINLKNMREKNVMTLMPEHLGDIYIEGASCINLYDDIKDFTGDVFIFHGKLDSRVPLEYAQRANDAYSNSQLIVFDDEEHRFTDKTKSSVVAKINSVINNNCKK